MGALFSGHFQQQQGGIYGHAVYIGDSEHHLVSEIQEEGVDDITGGHIPSASIKLMGNSLYSNSEDWAKAALLLLKTAKDPQASFSGASGFLATAFDFERK